MSGNDIGEHSPAANSEGKGPVEMSAPEEAQHLIELAQSRSNGGRRKLYTAVTDFYVRRALDISDDERALMLQIVQQLAGEVARDVRRALADRLARNPDAPHDLVVMLAHDDIEICHNLLTYSPVLQDPDLIEIIHHRTLAHKLGIAIRENLGKGVAAVLVATGEERVIATLLNNHSADLSRTSMQRIVNASREVVDYQAPLIRRNDLPPEMATDMLLWVSAALRSEILKRFDIDPKILDAEIVEAAADMVAGTENETTDVSPAERLVDKLHLANELTPAFAVKALRQGQVAVFEYALAKLTHLPLIQVRRTVFDPTGERLAVACRAIDFDRAAFRAVIDLVRKVIPDGGSPTGASKDKALEFYDRLTRSAALATLENWRHSTSPCDNVKVAGAL